MENNCNIVIIKNRTPDNSISSESSESSNLSLSSTTESPDKYNLDDYIQDHNKISDIVQNYLIILTLLCDNNEIPENNCYRSYIKSIDFFLNNDMKNGIILDMNMVQFTLKNYIKELINKKILLGNKDRNKKYKMIVSNLIFIIYVLNKIYKFFDDEYYNNSQLKIVNAKEKYEAYATLFDAINPGLNSNIVIDKENKIINYYYLYKELHDILNIVIIDIKF